MRPTCTILSAPAVVCATPDRLRSMDSGLNANSNRLSGPDKVKRARPMSALSSATARPDLTELVASFRRDGFVHAPAVLTPEEVARYRAAVDHAVETRKRNDRRALG